MPGEGLSPPDLENRAKLVLRRDGVAWSTGLGRYGPVRAGQTVDILIELIDVRRWVAHRHVAEHHESGMMSGFAVAPREGG